LISLSSEQSAAARKLARQLGSRRPGETVPLHELMVSGKRQRRPPRTVDELTDCASGKEQAELMLAIKNSSAFTLFTLFDVGRFCH
jgi:hypothetical protein